MITSEKFFDEGFEFEMLAKSKTIYYPVEKYEEELVI